MNAAERDVHWTTQALALAARGRGMTDPNPMVGAVVVAGGTVVGRGWHMRAGKPHAEITALRRAGSRARRATLYTTLEPCCHTDKRTPPCVPAIIASGVRRVVVAMLDPNPRVSGRGIRQLRRRGIAVDVGCLQREAAALNEAYCHWTRTGRPFVILKSAMTLDGKIATATGASKWITGAEARAHVHRLRSGVGAIAVGVNTVLRDDPRLTARAAASTRRAPATRAPVRVVFDSRLRTPLSARVLRDMARAPTVVATTTRADRAKIQRLRDVGAEVLVPALARKGGRVPIRRCLRELGRRGIISLLLEGGGELNAGFLREGLVNRVCLYVAPTLMGGRDAVGVLGGTSPRSLPGMAAVSDVRVRCLGNDLLVTGVVSRGTSAKSKTRERERDPR